MKIKKRSDNIIEIQMGTHFSNTSDIKLCGDDNFEDNSWITQSRMYILIYPKTNL